MQSDCKIKDNQQDPEIIELSTDLNYLTKQNEFIWKCGVMKQASNFFKMYHSFIK
jgi:hypothetical protein